MSLAAAHPSFLDSPPKRCNTLTRSGTCTRVRALQASLPHSVGVLRKGYAQMSVPCIEPLLCRCRRASTASRPRLRQGPTNSRSLLCGPADFVSAPPSIHGPRHSALPSNCMPSGCIAIFVAARGGGCNVDAPIMVHALVATSAVVAPSSLRRLLLPFILLVGTIAVEQVGEVHPARLAFPRHDPPLLLLLEGAGHVTSMAAAAVGPRALRRILMPPRCSCGIRRSASPLATSMSRSIKARRRRHSTLKTPLAVIPTAANTTNVLIASGTHGTTYPRALINLTPLDDHITISRGGAASMPLPSIALLVSQRRFRHVIMPTLALIATMLAAGRIGPMKPM